MPACPSCGREFKSAAAVALHLNHPRRRGLPCKPVAATSQPSTERGASTRSRPLRPGEGGTPQTRAELDRLLRRLASWENPTNDAPVAVTYRECLERADRSHAEGQAA